VLHNKANESKEIIDVSKLRTDEDFANAKKEFNSTM
jgi:hypothetical protein